MDFELVTNSGKANWHIEEQILLNNDSSSNRQFWMSDAGIISSYPFNCTKCMNSSLKLDHSKCEPFDNNNPIISLDDLVKHGGGGMYYKIMKCKSCKSKYYFGFGYIEPNYGRDVYVIHTILKVVNI
jgi:hypothetical protein